MQRITDGDMFFVPGNTSFRYWAEARFTKFMYDCARTQGLDALLEASWESAFYLEVEGKVRKDGVLNVLGLGGRL